MNSGGMIVMDPSENSGYNIIGGGERDEDINSCNQQEIAERIMMMNNAGFTKNQQQSQVHLHENNLLENMGDARADSVHLLYPGGGTGEPSSFNKQRLTRRQTDHEMQVSQNTINGVEILSNCEIKVSINANNKKRRSTSIHQTANMSNTEKEDKLSQLISQAEQKRNENQCASRENARTSS